METTYDEIRAVNISTLKHIEDSPLAYQHRLSSPEPEKPAFVLGNAGHCATLEPEKFDARYAVYDGIQRGKAWDAWQEEHPGIKAITPDDLSRARGMAKAVRSHRIAGPLLKGGRAEETVTWTDKETGLACKGRLDYLRPDFLIDLKTTRDPSPKNFQRAAFNYGYFAQVAWYHFGAVAARTIEGKDLPYIIAVESEAPYDVAVYQFDADALAIGQSIYQRWLRRLVGCIEANYWPGCAPDLQSLSVPQWAINQTVSAEEQEGF